MYSPFDEKFTDFACMRRLSADKRRQTGEMWEFCGNI